VSVTSWLLHAFQTAEAYAGVAIQDLIHQGLYLSHMGHSGGRVKQVAWVWLLGMNLAQNPQVYRSAELRDKSLFRQAEIQSCDEIVVADLFLLLTYLSVTDIRKRKKMQ